MTPAEIAVILVASPLVAALLYGAWKFSNDPETLEPAAHSRPNAKGKKVVST